MRRFACACHCHGVHAPMIRTEAHGISVNSETFMQDLVQTAIDAGAVIMDIYKTDFSVSHKSDDSPVTAADQRAEALILERLATIAPEIPVIAEESVAAGRVPDIGARFFLVDPLDGTKEFLNRNGDFTVNIALVENGVPVAGVVYAPARNDIYMASPDEGAKRGSVGEDGSVAFSPIAVRPVPEAGLVVVASRSHMTDETRDFVDKFTVQDLVSAGSSMKFCRVAAGEADLYPRLGRTMEWDTAAGDAVLRAAGGMVSTLDGKPLGYGKRNQADDTDFANPWFVAAGTIDPFSV